MGIFSVHRTSHGLCCTGDYLDLVPEPTRVEGHLNAQRNAALTSSLSLANSSRVTRALIFTRRCSGGIGPRLRPTPGSSRRRLFFFGVLPGGVLVPALLLAVPSSCAWPFAFAFSRAASTALQPLRS